MNKNFSRTLGRRGSALLIVSGVLILGFIISSYTIAGVLNTYRNVSRQVYMETAHFLAETGLHRAADKILTYSGAFPATYSDSGSLAGGSWSYTITRLGWRRYAIKSSGEYKGVDRKLRVGRARYPTFADFGVWTGDLQGLWTLPGTEWSGKYYSGTIINIFSSRQAGGPIFHGKVTSKANSFGGTPDYAVFEEGYQLGTQEGSLANVNFTEMEGEAQMYGMVLQGETEAEFKVEGGVGKLYLRNPDKWPDNNFHAVNVSNQEIIYIRDYSKRVNGKWRTYPGTLTVKGSTVKGKMSFFTESDITIQGNILMHDNPETNVNSQDKLGLITKEDIWVGKSAPNNVKMQTALLATGQKSGGGRFGVIDYDSGSPRGIRYLFGSQATAITAAAGRFNSSTGVVTSGYKSSIMYDTRFLADPPPYYPPLDDKLIFEDWGYDEI